MMPVSAGAQDGCYPSGCSSTTTSAPPPGPSCGISLEAGQVGAEVIVTVHNVPLGGEVKVLLGGDEVTRGRSQPAVQPIRSMPVQSAVSDVVMSFDIPDLDPGSYSIAAVGVGFTVTCGAGGLDVLAAGAGGGGGGGGALAFTGAQILGLVLLALVLIAIGYVLVRRSRERRPA